jgi:hypothetical protein
MRTITTILDPHSDGTLHLPLPAELAGGRVKVTATLAAADETVPATTAMVRRRLEALEHLRALNPFRGIADPVAWHREIRQDRPLPGRD